MAVSSWKFGIEEKTEVGVFNRLENAEVRRQQIAKLGVAAEIFPREQERTVWWLDLKPLTAQRIEEAVIKKRRQAIRHWSWSRRIARSNH